MNNELYIFLQESAHFINYKQFSTQKPELFRLILIEIFIYPYKSNYSEVFITTSLFYIFISKSLYIENINFYGNDISLKDIDVNFCSQNNTSTCCLQRISYLKTDSPCYLNSSKILEISNSESRGLFNIEKIIDVSDYPYFYMKNCKFFEFNLIEPEGFLSIIYVSNFHGNVTLENLIINGSFFRLAFIKDSPNILDVGQSEIINDLIIDENMPLCYYLKNVSFIDYNVVFSDSLPMQVDLFILQNLVANFTIENSYFTNIFSSTLFKIENEKRRLLNFLMINTNYTNLMKTTILLTSNFYGNLKISSIFSLFVMKTPNLFLIKNTYNLRIEKLFIFNSTTTKDLALIDITNTLSNFSHIFAENCQVFTILKQSFLSLDMSDLFFNNITFIRSIIYLVQVQYTSIKNSSMTYISGPLAIFYYQETTYFILEKFSIIFSRLSSVFYADKAILFLARECLIKSNNLDLLMRSDQTCDQTFIRDSQIAYNFFNLPLYRNVMIFTSDIYFDNVSIANNNFAYKMLISISAGNTYFNKLNFIENFCVAPANYAYFIIVQMQVKFVFTNSLVYNCGLNTKKALSSYQSSFYNCFFLYQRLKYCILDNISFIVTKEVELVSGFISGSPSGDYMEVNNCKFIIASMNPNFSYKAILLDSCNMLKLVNNSFSNIICNNFRSPHSSGAVYIIGSSSPIYSMTVEMRNNSFGNCSCPYGGSLAIYSIYNISLRNCSFTNSYSDYNGGAFLIQSSSIISLSDLIINETNGNSGGAMFIVFCDKFVLFNILISSIISKGNGAIYLQNVQNFTMKTCVCVNALSISLGGFIFNLESHMYLISISMMNTSAQEGGCIFIHGQKNVVLNEIVIKNSFSNIAGVFSISSVNRFLMKNISIENSISFTYGGVMMIYEAKSFLVDILKISKAYSIKAGTIYIKSNDENSVIEFHDTLCASCFSYEGSFIYHFSAVPIKLEKTVISNAGAVPMYFRWSYIITVILRETILINCIVDTTLIYLENIETIFFRLDLLKNKAYDAFIRSKNGAISIMNGTFIDSDSKDRIFSFISNNFQLENIYIKNFIDDLIISICYGESSDGNIRNMTALGLNLNSDFLMSFVSGKIQLSNILLLNNNGSILILSQSHLKISDFDVVSWINVDQFFIAYFMNYLSSEFDVIFKNVTILIQSSQKQISQVVQAFFFLGLIRIFFDGGSLKYQYEKIYLKITALYCESIKFILISQLEFVNFTDHGIVIANDNSNHLLPDVIISNSLFQENKANLGGAIFLKGFLKVNVLLNSFTQNFAITENDAISQGVAACIFFSSNFYESFINILFNDFSKNNAANYISTVFSEALIQINEQNIIWQNNDNGLFFSFPFSSYRKNDPNHYINVVSGVEMEISFELVDNSKNVLFFENNIIFTLKLSSNISQKSIMIDNHIANLKNGIARFPNLKVLVAPDTYFNLTLSAIFRNNPIQNEYEFYARPCQFGEILKPNLACLKCPKGFYSLIDPMITNIQLQKCHNCPINAFCPGGFVILPLSGYFRKTNVSLSVIQCTIQKSCLGYIFSENIDYTTINSTELIHGKCLDGNSGNLCYYCDYGYGRETKDDICKICSSVLEIVVVKLIIYSLIVILYIVLNFNIAESFANSKDKDNETQNNNHISTYLKFFVNHSQQISFDTIETNFSFSGLINLSDYFTLNDNNSITNDCLIQKFFFDKITFLIWKDIINMFIPIIFSILGFAFWCLSIFIISLGNQFKYLKKKLPNNANEFFKKIQIFAFLSTFIFYALILKVSLNLFNCINLDLNETSTYLKYSPNLECWMGVHLKFVLFFGVTSISFWGVLFPIFLGFSLYQNHKTISISKQTGIETIIRSKSKTKTKPEMLFVKVQKQPNKSMELNNAEIDQILSSKFVQRKITSKAKSRNSMAHEIISYIMGSKVFFFFFKDCKDDFFYYETLIFVRKFILTFINTIDQVVPDEVRLTMIIVLIGIFLNFVRKKLPYKLMFSNYLEIFSLNLIILTNVTNFISKTKISENFKLPLIIFTLLTNFLYFAFISLKIIENSYHIYISKNKTFHQGLRKINCCFFIRQK